MRDFLGLYSLNERIFFVKTFYKNDSDVNCVKTNYLLEFGEIKDIPSDQIIYDAISLFEKTGNISEVPEFLIKNFKCDENSSNHHLEEDSDLLANIKVEVVEEDTNEEDPFNTLDSNETTSQIKIESNEHGEDAEEAPMSDVKEEVFELKFKKPTRNKKKKKVADVDNATTDELPKNPKTCTHCKLILPSKYKLRIHVRTEHAEELKKAKERKANKAPRKCPYCPKEWKGKRSYERHIAMHTDKKEAICDVCGKGFRTAFSMSKHMLIHTGEKPYKCDYPKCERVFRNQNCLSIHKRCHTGERPYACEYCGKGFTDKSTLRVHYRQHTGESPYKCELCGKTTKQKQNLKSHMKHIHNMD
ncbi:zinc finger protein 253-like [Lutzomyia longipalpis]|uniref:zinc finger protein 253-like n=1 Tax=Lutzomyia longipalpis TaxID=7200 RepID=UPI0024834205|nr:zinc finger protein 253-like [Lutzomyia longipalpis]